MARFVSLNQPVRTWRVFCINLDHRTDRWARAQKVISSGGFDNVERFSAIEGSKLRNLDKLMSFRARADLVEPLHTHESLPNLGALGCALSHIAVWRRLRDDPNASEYVVFEDDPRQLPGNFDQVLARTLEQIRKQGDFDVLLLGYSLLLCPTSDHSVAGLIRLHGRFFGMHAYVITRRGADKLLREALPVEVQVDAYVGLHATLFPEFVLLSFEKSQCAQSLDVSDIQHYDCPHCWSERRRHMTQEQARELLANRKKHGRPLRLNLRTVASAVGVVLGILLILVLVFLAMYVRCKSAPARARS